MSHTPTQTSAQVATAQPPSLLDFPQEILNVTYAFCLEDLIVNIHRHDVTNELHIVHRQSPYVPYGLPCVNKLLQEEILSLLAKSKPLHLEKPSLLVERNLVDPMIPKFYANNLQTLIIDCSEKPAVQTVRIALFPNLKTLLFRSSSTVPLGRFLDPEVKTVTHGWTKARISAACIGRVTDCMRDDANFLLDQLQIRCALNPLCIVKLEMQFGTFEATVLTPRKYLKGSTFTATIIRSAGGDWENEKIEFSKAFETWDTMVANGEKGAVWGWLMDD